MLNDAQGELTETNYGRGHHPRCFTMWMAGGARGGQTYGGTDDFSHNIVENTVDIHDLHATSLHGGVVSSLIEPES